jgi:hypothetical protein
MAALPGAIALHDPGHVHRGCTYASRAPVAIIYDRSHCCVNAMLSLVTIRSSLAQHDDLAFYLLRAYASRAGVAGSNGMPRHHIHARLPIAAFPGAIALHGLRHVRRRMCAYAKGAGVAYAIELRSRHHVDTVVPAAGVAARGVVALHDLDAATRPVSAQAGGAGIAVCDRTVCHHINAYLPVFTIRTGRTPPVIRHRSRTDACRSTCLVIHQRHS